MTKKFNVAVTLRGADGKEVPYDYKGVTDPRKLFQSMEDFGKPLKMAVVSMTITPPAAEASK